MVDQMTFADLGLWFGKTPPERSAPSKERTLPPSLKKRLGLSPKQSPYCKFLRVDGPSGEVSPTLTDDGALLGELWTLNTGEEPSESEILALLWSAVRRNAAGGSFLLPTSTEELLRLYCSEKATLTETLEDNADEKYKLSVRACEGILRRSEKRGKALPEVLDHALKQQIEAGD